MSPRGIVRALARRRVRRLRAVSSSERRARARARDMGCSVVKSELVRTQRAPAGAHDMGCERQERQRTPAPSPELQRELRAARCRVMVFEATAARCASDARAFDAIHTELAARLARSYRARARDYAAKAKQAREALDALQPRRERCGARCRDGHACNAPPSGHGGRCKLHGGRSTGPRTPEGKARALAALQRARESRDHAPEPEAPAEPSRAAP